jgi:NAD+ kinase
MKHIGLVVHPGKARDENFIKALAAWLEGRGVSVTRYRCAAADALCDFPERMPALDLIITLGGDGTLLSAARRLAGIGVPLLGVNMGHLGFITDMEMPDLFPNLERLIAGDFIVETRMMLEAEVRRGGATAASFLALNDAVITKGPLSRMVTLENYVGGEYLATYRADGIIVATPTGSTAYSLSAGGPIVSPELEMIIVTPICSHTLYARPYITAGHHAIRVVLKSDPLDAMLTIDGQAGFPLRTGDEILIRKAGEVARLVRLRNRPFFEVVRLKLREGEAGDHS